jgi:hypothetical protein
MVRPELGLASANEYRYGARPFTRSAFLFSLVQGSVFDDDGADQGKAEEASKL